MPKIFCDVIQNQALSSENEIYGWLIGFQMENIPTVLAIVECNKFEQQTLISAIPHAQEFQEISSIMPQGIGPIGIYHSHPFSSEIFHSHTDDKTLLSLSNQFPNSISLVTNGKEINYYQMTKTKEIKEIDINFSKPQKPGFVLISINEDIIIETSNNFIEKNSYDNKLKIKILNNTKQLLEVNWETFDFLYQKNPISENDLIESFISNHLIDEPIKIKIPENLRLLKINTSKNESASDLNNQIRLKLRLNTKIPIYITERDLTFSEIKQSIKTELLSNNIHHKIYRSILDTKTNSIILPNDYYIRFFGFFLRFVYFNKIDLNEKELSAKNFEFFMKLISLFKSFTKLGLDPEIRDYLESFLVDAEIFSTNFSWHDKLKKIIKNIKKKI